MRIGTKSLLFGAHQFLLHPLCVAVAWWKLFGVPKDPVLWVAFFVHDLGYFGKENMDGEEGEKHVLLGAAIMGKLFGDGWATFTLLHSRYYAKKLDSQPSRLCLADKYAFCVMPRWLYLVLTRATGEIREYQGVEKHQAETGFKPAENSWAQDVEWHKSLYSVIERYVKDPFVKITVHFADATFHRGPNYHE